MAKSKKKMPAPVAAPVAAAATTSPTALMSGSEKIAWYAMHVMIFLVPLAMSNWTMSAWTNPPGLFGGLPFTYDQFDIVKVFIMRAATLVAVGAWGWGMLTSGGKLRKTPQFWLVVALLGWLALTTVFSIHPPTALFGKYRRFEGLISFINYAAVFFLALQFADKPSRMRSLARTLAISGALVSLYGVMQYVGWDFIDWRQLPFEQRRAFATYGNPDLLGGFLMFPLPIALALALSEENTRWRAAYWTMFLLTGACLFVSSVRGAWIGGFVALVLLGIIVFLARPKFSAVDGGFLIAAGVVLAGLVAVSLANPNDVMNVGKRIVSIFQFSEGSAKSRFQIWDAAWRAVKARPIFGFGPDTFRLVFPMYKPVEYVSLAGYLSVADNVHNYPLQLTSSVGIPGFGLLYGLFAWILGSSAPSAWARGRGSERLVLAGFWTAAVGYLVHLMFGLSVTGSTVLLWLCLGVLLAPFARTVEWKAPAFGQIAAIGLLVVVALGFIGNMVYIQADRHYLRARVAAGSPDERIAEVEKAIELNPFNDMYRAELGLAYQDQTLAYLNQFQQLQQQGQAQQAQQARQAAFESFQSAETAMLDTIEFVPPEYDNYVFLSSLYNMAGQYFANPEYLQDAVDVAEKGIKVEPFGPAVRYQQAMAYQGLGELDKALEQATRAFEMDPAYSDPLVLMADIYREQGRLELAKETYEKALKYNLDWRKPQVEQSLAAVEASLGATGGAEPSKTP